ncbi:ATP-binding cassette domain-containing protein [Nonomuraea phyllanthi]|uniref:ABC transporter ATP-binding protein n=1 Tax=Nonomuraea phyllanthi TaxID=2219224 RepID=UPI0012933E53|nr:ABC transporter ATP-binding protein [Nonomuraea phyllanthi]QFY07351.1 ATP-binding cassette domain-containing protein [Nonomuraea phyllanthi]
MSAAPAGGVPGEGPPRRPLRHAVAVGLLSWRAGPGLVACQLAVTVVAGLLPTGSVWGTKILVDGLTAGDPDQAFQAAGVLALLGLAAGVLPHLTRYLRAELDRRLDRLLQDELYASVTGFQGLSRFENPAFLDRLRMAAEATGGALTPVTSGLFDAARNVITLVSLLASLTVLSPVMAGLVTAAAVPALIARMAMVRRRVGMLAGLSATARRQILYSSLITDVRAAKEVRLFGLGGFLKSRVLGELATLQAGERRLDRRESLTQSLLALLSAAVAGAGLLWVVPAALSGALTLGDVTAFAAAVAGTQAALVGLVETVAGAHHALLLFSYHAEVTSLPDDLPAPHGETAVLPALRHGIELRDVWFRYDDDHPWVLRGVDLTIPHGASVALVGLNGAGKSTLIKLLCRFYDPSRGSIHWDGVDIRDVPPGELRRRMGVLFQDYMCYDLTAAENIAMGEIEALHDRSRIASAARLAGVHDIVRALPRGYDTLLSRIFFGPEDEGDPQAGVVLSGGQWQRLALARALLREGRDLLILDEPSAGLDARAEHEIHTRLVELRAGRTSLLVSHRLGTVRAADLIVVLRDGEVVERGTHDDLMAAGGGYAELFDLQARDYLAEAET